MIAGGMVVYFDRANISAGILVWQLVPIYHGEWGAKVHLMQDVADGPIYFYGVL